MDALQTVVFRASIILQPRVCSNYCNVSDFNNRNQYLITTFLKQVNRYHKIRKASSKFNSRHSELIVKCNISLKGHL